MNKIRFWICAVLLLAACKSTSVKESWKNPQVSRIQFRKVAAIAMTRDPTSRRIAEDELVKKIEETQLRAVQGYKFLGERPSKDPEAVRKQLAEAGFDGAVTMRLVGQRQETTYSPPTNFYGFYGGAWPYAYAPGPGVVETYTLAQIETDVYSVPDGKLIWSGLSETFEPTKTKDLVDHVSDAVAKQLEKEGLIAPRS